MHLMLLMAQRSKTRGINGSNGDGKLGVVEEEGKFTHAQLLCEVGSGVCVCVCGSWCDPVACVMGCRSQDTHIITKSTFSSQNVCF